MDLAAASHTIRLSKENFGELRILAMTQAQKSLDGTFKVKVSSADSFDQISEEEKIQKMLIKINRGFEFTVIAISDIEASKFLFKMKMYRNAIFLAFEFAQKMMKAAIANYSDDETFQQIYLEENLDKLSAIIADKMTDENAAKHLVDVASKLEEISVGTKMNSMSFKEYSEEEAENADSLSHEIFETCIDLLKAKIVELSPSKTFISYDLNAEIKIDEKNEIWFYLFQ